MLRSKPDDKPKGGRGNKSPDPRRIVTTGIKTSEYAELQRMADANQVTVNALMAFFLRHSMQLHRDGKLKVPTVPIKGRKIQM